MKVKVTYKTATDDYNMLVFENVDAVKKEHITIEVEVDGQTVVFKIEDVDVEITE